MGWRNLEIDRLMIDALIAHRYDAGDDQFNPPAWGPSNPEMPADSVSAGIRGTPIAPSPTAIQPPAELPGRLDELMAWACRSSNPGRNR